MKNNIVQEILLKLYKEEKYDNILDITRLDFSIFNEEILLYINEMNTQDVIVDIFFFNLSIVNNDYKILPIYFPDDSWFILDILEINQNKLESIAIIKESNLQLIDKSFRLIDFIRNVKNGILNYKDFIKELEEKEL